MLVTKGCTVLEMGAQELRTKSLVALVLKNEAEDVTDLLARDRFLVRGTVGGNRTGSEP